MKTNKVSPIQRFWRLLSTDKKEIRDIYVYSVFSGLIGLSLPLGIQAIVNLIQGGQVSTSWIVLVFFVVLGIILAGVMQILQLKLTENIQQKIFTRAAFEFTYRIPHIKMETLYNQYAPELMNRFFDVNSVQKGLSKILIDFSSAFFLAVFSLILLSFYHPFFILFSLVLLVLVYTIFFFTAKRGMDTSLDESKYKYKVAHWLEELSRTSTIFKLAGESKLPFEKTDFFVGRYLKSRNNHFNVLVVQYILLIVFKVVVATGLLVIGSLLVIDQQMNIGQFIAAEIIILLVFTSVEKLIVSLESIYDILTSLEKIGHVTDLELDREAGIEPSEGVFENGVEIEVKGITFAYPDSRDKELKNISFIVPKGNTVAITGKNGMGKSSLLQILAGLYDLQEGTISFNNYPLGNLSLELTRKMIGEYINSDKLFEGTVLENITLGRDEATIENVNWAIENVGLSDYIMKLPHGYDTSLLTQGKTLPENVVTKLLIARCVVTKPKIVLLENSLENLDKIDRNRIVDFLSRKENQWTFVMVTTNPDILKKANKVIELRHGELGFEGSPQEFLAHSKL